MPRHPPQGAKPNPRLDRYRHRAARFRNDSGRRGHFYVQPSELATAISGHLWWKRWSPPQEFVILWIEDPDGRDTDTWILPEDLDAELDDWDRGQFRYLGDIYQLTWLGDDATNSIRQALQIDTD